MSAQPLQQWQLAQRGQVADFADTVADDNGTDKGLWEHASSASKSRSDGDMLPYGSSSEEEGSEEESSDEHDAPCPQAVDMVKSDRFGQLVAGAILASTIIIAGETDYDGLWIWDPLNLLFYCFFTVEIILRLGAYGWDFFRNDEMCWNIFDISLVLGSWFSLFADLLVDSNQSGSQAKLSHYLTLLRVVRILRILRVLRLFKQCSQLMLLANGLMESVQMVFWIMVLMFMFMIIFAIILTDLIGNQSYKFEEPEQIEEYWHGVIRSLITLFQFLTLDNWSEITRQVTDTMPWMRIVFCFYIFIAAFAMLALLTGVIADHMGTVSDNQQKDEKAEKQQELEVFTNKLRDSLVRSAGVTKKELSFSREDLRCIMADEQLTVLLEGYGVTVTDHELDELFDFLDQNGDGLVTWAEFKAGVFRLREEKPLAWDLLRIRFVAERVAHSLEGGMGEAATLRKLDEVKDSMATAEQRLHRMEVRLRGFMAFAREPRHGSTVSLLGSFMQTPQV